MSDIDRFINLLMKTTTIEELPEIELTLETEFPVENEVTGKTDFETAIKYIQENLVIDHEPIAQSENLISSGAVYDSVKDLVHIDNLNHWITYFINNQADILHSIIDLSDQIENIREIIESVGGDGGWNPPPPGITVTAGADKTVLLPEHTVTLIGEAESETGTIESVLWTMVIGHGDPEIVSPNELTTEVTGLGEGEYIFKLTATDSNGKSASADTVVTVRTVMQQEFFENGAFTVPSGVHEVFLTACGGGAGAAGGRAGGAGEAVLKRKINVTPGEEIEVYIGKGGPGSNAASNNSGGPTIFGGKLVLNGGALKGATITNGSNGIVGKGGTAGTKALMSSASVGSGGDGSLGGGGGGGAVYSDTKGTGGAASLNGVNISGGNATIKGNGPNAGAAGTGMGAGGGAGIGAGGGGSGHHPDAGASTGGSGGGGYILVEY